MTTFYVGTAGWSYLQWEKEFYPPGTKTADKLAYYATRFNAVELNNSFYHTPSVENYAHWQAQVPANFRFAVKASRYITHIKRLKDAAETVPSFLESLNLDKPGPLFFQLPPNLKVDMERLQQWLKTLPKKQACTIELRHPSWHVDEVYALLRKHGVAFCLYDTPEGISPRVLTTDFAYVRLRGREKRGLKPFLSEWRDFLSDHTKTAYVFFDNREEKRLGFGNALAFQDLL